LEKYREYSIWKRSMWSLKAMNDLVSDKAGECEVIPPEEWNVTLRDGVNQDCSQMRSGGIAGEGRSVANEIGYFLRTMGGITLFGDELLYCKILGVSESESNFSTFVESACWPSSNPILDKLYDKLDTEVNSVRLTMKLPLMHCAKYSPLMKLQISFKKNIDMDEYNEISGITKYNEIDVSSMENIFVPMENVTVVSDLPLCMGDLPGAEKSSSLDTRLGDLLKMSIMMQSLRIVDPSPPSDGGDELGVGEIAGIVIGCIALVGGVAVASIVIYRRRRQAQQVLFDSSDEEDGSNEEGGNEGEDPSLL